jgi:hypothetical protein
MTTSSTHGKRGLPDDLLPQHRKDLDNSGLSPEQIDLCGFYSITDPREIAEVLGWDGMMYTTAVTGARALGACLAIPFYDADGNFTGYTRLKPDKSRTEKDGKPVRYESPRGKPNRAYFPPVNRAALSDQSTPLLITEGEKKAAKADQDGFACVGLVGVYGWQKKQEQEEKGTLRELIDDLAGVAWQGRSVYLCYDSDLATNENVRWAQWNLAQVLKRKGATVKVVCLPQGPCGTDGKPLKVGLDDYLKEQGAAAFRELLRDADSPEGGDGAWPDLLPLGEPPPAPCFPIDVLPGCAAQMVEQIAWAMNVPPDLAAVPLLVLAGGAIANSRQLAITHSHKQSACLYAAVVSPPGTMKSPVLKLLRRPFELMQQQFLDEWRICVRRWDEEGKDKECKEERGPRPIPRRCITSDTTTETLGLILMQNPRGLLLVRDELSGLMAAMNQYKHGRGDDRQTYLQMWGGDTIIKDRKSEKMLQGAPLFVRNPFVAIVGTIQPDVFPFLRGEAVRGIQQPDDGWLDRFLTVYPSPLPDIGEQWREVSPETQAAWEEVVKKLLSLQMVDQADLNPRPYFVKLTQSGKEQWKRFRDAHAAETRVDGFPHYLEGAWSKLRGYAARLALIIHFLRWACGEVGEMDEDVDGEDMERAACLVAYFKGHVKRVAAMTGGNPRMTEARRVLRWIVEGRRTKFSKRDVHQGVKGTFKSVEDIYAPLQVLEKHNIIRPKEMEYKGRGQKPSQMYEVHPETLQTYSQNAQNSPHWTNSEHSEHSENRFYGATREPGEDDDDIVSPQREADVFEDSPF